MPPLEPAPWYEALLAGNYLRVLRVLREYLDQGNPITYDQPAYWLQAVGRFADADSLRQERAELERRQTPTEPLRLIGTGVAKPRPPPAPQTTPAEAAPRLIQMANDRRLVLLGEEHHHPEHRAFGARVLGQLRAAGVTHLALETGQQAPLDEAHQTGRVTPTTDGFAFEPRRADLLRAAFATGLEVVAFDVSWEDIAWMQAHPADAAAYRERTMAQHIVERILRPSPRARVLVWVGYGHVQKWSLGGLRMMAQHLAELADQEPLSVYQLTGPGDRPGVDLLLRHPAPRYTNGRPDWLRTPDRRTVRGVVDPAAEYLVQLHLASEGEAGTPVDQLLTQADGAFELLVPAGQYLLRVWSGAEQVVLRQELRIQDDGLELRLAVA